MTEVQFKASSKLIYGEVPPDQVQEGLEPNTLIIDDELLRSGFTAIPNYVLEDTHVSLGGRFTYVLLLSFAWQHGSCFPGQKRLGLAMGIKERMVRYYLTELIEKGYIGVTRRGLNKTNIYHILRVRLAKPEVERQNIADQERQSVSHQERQNIADKEYTVEEDSDRKDSDHSKIRKIREPRKKPSGVYSEEIAQAIDGLSKRELNDPVHINSNITQAQNLWRDLKASEEEFIRLIQEARKRTLQHSDMIRKTTAGGRGTKNRAPYFFKVLKVLTREATLANFRQGFKSPP